MEAGAKDPGCVKPSQSRGSGFKRINMHRAHLGLEFERQINPEFPRQRRVVRGRAPNEGSFTEFEKNRGPRLGLSYDEIGKIGQTYSCIRQSRLNTDAEKRNLQRESFRRFETRQEEKQQLDSPGKRTPVVLPSPGSLIQAAPKISTEELSPRLDTQKTKKIEEPKVESTKNEDEYHEVEPIHSKKTSQSRRKEPLFPVFATDRRIVRGRNTDKPRDNKNCLKQGLSERVPDESTTGRSYKPYPCSLYIPTNMQRPVWADRVITSIGSGHWYLPLNHLSSVDTVYHVKYLNDADVKRLQQENRAERSAQDRRKVVFRSEYSSQFQDLGEKSRMLNGSRTKCNQ